MAELVIRGPIFPGVEIEPDSFTEAEATEDWQESHLQHPGV